MFMPTTCSRTPTTSLFLAARPMTFLLLGCTAAALPSRRAEAALISTDAAASQSTPLSILQVGDSFMEYSVQLLGDYYRCIGCQCVVHASFAVGGSQSCPSLEGRTEELQLR